MITSITKALFMSKELSESLAKDRSTKKKHKTNISWKNCCPRTEAGWQGGGGSHPFFQTDQEGKWVWGRLASGWGSHPYFQTFQKVKWVWGRRASGRDLIPEYARPGTHTLRRGFVGTRGGGDRDQRVCACTRVLYPRGIIRRNAPREL